MANEKSTLMLFKKVNRHNKADLIDKTKQQNKASLMNNLQNYLSFIHLPGQYGDKEVLELWPLLQRKLPGMFKGLEIMPSLLHGDLWSGNAAETKDGPGVCV